MRQVPAPAPAPFGIVGDGRVARHIRHYFALLGLPTRTWSRRDPHPSPPEALAPCGTILLLIQDAAIVPFVEAWPALRAKRLVHFAGSLVAPAIAAVHPLMTFGPDLYDLATYRTVPFILDAEGPAFAELLPGLPNPSYRIPADQRPYYHALCVMAGNFSTLLWRKLFEELQSRFDVPAEVAYPYLRGVVANLIAHAGSAITGPLARHDVQTIAANLRALEGDPYQAVYAAFAKAHE
jgi:hypothetical protein